MSTEADAIAALRRGEIDGLADLVGLHQLKALRTAYGILGERAAAEDVVADAFLKVYERISTFGRDRPFEPWFYRIVVNLAIDHRRKDRAVDPGVPGKRSELAGAGGFDGLEQRIVLAELIRGLPNVERAALVLRYYLDLDETAIAAILGCPVGTVKSRLHRGRDRLRLQLTDAREGWTAAHIEGA